MLLNSLAIVIVMNLFFPCITKITLIETRKMPGRNESLSTHFYDDVNEISVDESSNDYMAEVEIKSVKIGRPVHLKCASPKEFSTCLFTKVDDHIFYEIQPKVSFEDRRLQCL